MLKEKIDAVSAKDQYHDFKNTRFPQAPGVLLTFDSAGQGDVYNTSVPFDIDGRRVIAGRVEARSTEQSHTAFFEQNEDRWVRINDAPILPLQDPFITWVGDELVLGGVNVDWDGDRLIEYRTKFYRGTSLDSLAHFADGPKNMKDIRLVELADRRIGLFSRPQGQPMLDKYGCIARIGFSVLDSLDRLTPEAVDSAPLLEGQFLPDEWGGCNQLIMLKNGLIGFIGHKSWGEDVDDVYIIHYYAMAFAIDPDSRKITQVKIIGSRECFPDGPQKNPRAKDVTFTSGIERLANGKALLYAGLSDCQEGCVEIDDPLIEYENLR